MGEEGSVEEQSFTSCSYRARAFQKAVKTPFIKHKAMITPVITKVIPFMSH